MEREKFLYEDEQSSEQNVSVLKIFESERQKYIAEAGEQLKAPKFAEVEIDGEKLKVDYRIISIKNLEKKNADPVIVLPGFGSGWEGISELAFSLACEGRRIVTFSLPGYGNSDTPSEKYNQKADFSNEAEAAYRLIEKLKEIGGIKNRKVHLVGHSMAGAILSEFSSRYPEKVASLTLLDSSGINEKEDIISMAAKFVVSGIHTTTEYKARLALSGEKDYERELYEHIPKTKSPFAANRIKQRLSEARKLSSGRIVKNLQNITVPITYMSGELDIVFPSGEKDDENSQLAKVVNAVNNKASITTSILYGLRHNTTVSADEITAANIEHYLEEAENKNKNKEF